MLFLTPQSKLGLFYVHYSELLVLTSCLHCSERQCWHVGNLLFFYPLDIFRTSPCANRNRLNKPREKSNNNNFENTPSETLLLTSSSPHFHLKLSAEAGAMFVSALIVLLGSFLLNVSFFFQAGTAQRRGEANEPRCSRLRGGRAGKLARLTAATSGASFQSKTNQWRTL